EVARVGGDWYELLSLPGRRTLIAIGDVAGHGIAAAATMAKLRHALAALTVTTTEPAELLGYLNRVLWDDPAQPTGTALVARYDPADRTLLWAQAGHLAPVRLGPGSATLLDRPYGVLLGGMRDTAYRHASTTIDPADTLLFYTDGLIERRDADIVTCMHELPAALAADRDHPLP